MGDGGEKWLTNGGRFESVWVYGWMICVFLFLGFGIIIFKWWKGVYIVDLGLDKMRIIFGLK